MPDPPAGFPIGLRNTLLTADHYHRMGITIWVYAWLVDHVTEEYTRPDGEARGRVLGGAVIRAEQIAQQFGVSAQTVRNHLQALFRAGYISRRQRRDGFQIEVCHSQKWPRGASTSPESPERRVTELQGSRLEGSLDPSTLRPLNPREPTNNDIAEGEDIAEDIHGGEEGATELEAVWADMVRRLAAHQTPAAVAAANQCRVIGWDGTSLRVEVPADEAAAERVRRLAPVIRTEIRAVTGAPAEIQLIDPSEIAARGP